MPAHHRRSSQQALTHSDWRSQISNHDQFEELSALAAAGEIGFDDWQTLKAHLEECASCRSVFADVGEIHAKWLPEHPDFEIAREPQSDVRLRKAILKRATKDGARLSRAAQFPGYAREVRSRAWTRPRLWVFATATIVVFVVGVGVILQQSRPWLTSARTTGNSETVVKNSTPSKPRNVEVEELSGRQRAQEALEAALKASQAERDRLREQLEKEEGKAAASEHDSMESMRLVADLRQQLESARNATVNAQTALTKLQSAQATNEAVTVAQEQEIQELNAKLADQAGSVERERELLAAGREIRDLIAARNLHIIDVYDTDSHGKTSPAFGRVFYTEGKSLVFYAYDLNPDRPEAGKYAFYVWGRRDGAPQDIKGLGAFSKDDQKQKRWVLTVSDPKVLAEIDSVFVTLEPAGRTGKHPSGKKLLSAFLGTPANHP